MATYFTRDSNTDYYQAPDIKKGLNGLAFNSISSLAMSNQMIIKIIKYL
jgi:hypothetical protein